jgi:hypothetical protein
LGKRKQYKINQRIVFVKKDVKMLGVIKTIRVKRNNIVIRTVRGDQTVSMDSVFPFDLGGTLNIIKQSQSNNFQNF